MEQRIKEDVHNGMVEVRTCESSIHGELCECDAEYVIKTRHEKSTEFKVKQVCRTHYLLACNDWYIAELETLEQIHQVNH